MGNLASDREAGFELVREETEKLKKHNPNHPLLTIDTKEFADRYAPDEKTPLAVMATNYFIDLARAVDEYTGENRFPIQQENTSPPSLETDIEKFEFPF